VLSGYSDAKGLAWPLHAIGDVCAPHHVVGTTSWGHRPFEEIVDHHEPSFIPEFDTDDAGTQLRSIVMKGFSSRTRRERPKSTASAPSSAPIALLVGDASVAHHDANQRAHSASRNACPERERPAKFAGRVVWLRGAIRSLEHAVSEEFRVALVA